VAKGQVCSSSATAGAGDPGGDDEGGGAGGEEGQGGGSGNGGGEGVWVYEVPARAGQLPIGKPKGYTARNNHAERTKLGKSVGCSVGVSTITHLKNGKERGLAANIIKLVDQREIRTLRKRD